MTITGYFETLKTKDIICWGSGKHFRNTTYPFLLKSGLIENLRGFVDVPGSSGVEIGGRAYDRIGKDELAGNKYKNALILISVTGYEEILTQIRSDSELKTIEAVPSIFIESVYEDILLLSAEKPPVNYRKHDVPVIPRTIHGIWFSDNPLGCLSLDITLEVEFAISCKGGSAHTCNQKCACHFFEVHDFSV